MHKNLTFGKAIEALKSGHRVARANWENGTHLFLMRGQSIQTRVTERYGNGVAEETPVVMDSICMYTSEKKVIIGWLANQTDILAEDWTVILDKVIEK